jgi:hypothetical protein
MGEVVISGLIVNVPVAGLLEQGGVPEVVIDTV